MRWPIIRMTLGFALVHCPTEPERDRGRQLLTEVKRVFISRGHNLGDLPFIDVCLGWELARCGERDDAISLLRTATDHLFRDGRLLSWSIPQPPVF